MEGKKKTLVTIGLLILGIGFVFFLAVYMVPRVLVTFTKAAPATKISISESRVMGDKILAKADGIDACKVNVFVLDNSSKGVMGKTVVLSGLSDIASKEDVTDSEGRISFAIKSKIEGTFTLIAAVEGVELPKGIKVTFRN